MTGNGFDSFFRERFSALVALLVVMGASRADAEDATLDAMVQAWKQWDSIHDRAAWVRTVAVRKWWKLVRTRRHTVPFDEHSPEPTVQSDLDMLAEQQRVMDLLRRLPPKQRMVAALYYDGASCEEIAGLLNMPAGTIRSHLRHAREALMKALKEVILSELQRFLYTCSAWVHAVNRYEDPKFQALDAYIRTQLAGAARAYESQIDIDARLRSVLGTGQESRSADTSKLGD